ncbi:hypothetical protein ACLI1A_07165 [Flavobacterium sp. RHBU_3]|uniref:DUF7660 family protein n=1 Tax=Flavobacterium sp. RHBU_3 TaxID=3391184 RepID=UPI0039848D8D
MADDMYSIKVTNRESFVKFLDLVLLDFLQNPDEWENKTLADFLESMGRYTNDVQGYYNNMKMDVNADVPAWSTFADIFRGAKVYE